MTVKPQLITGKCYATNLYLTKRWRIQCGNQYFRLLITAAHVMPWMMTG